MVAELRDPTYAENIQLLCEYDPHPPFHAGSMHQAPSGVRATMTSMLSGFTARAHELARKLQG